MCGFAGVVVWEQQFRVSRETLGRMSAAIAHRGPDGEGVWINHDREIDAGHPQARLAFRRLAVLDPTPRADQPFADAGGRKRLVFNGEIYNFRDLRDELSRLRPDYAWRTSGDTEVLMLAHEVWGEGCVERLNGMFAFAIWDESAGTLLLARDRMGQKPLYYAMAGAGALRSAGLSGVQPRSVAPLGAIAFASELAALRAVPWVDASLNIDGLTDYLCYGYIPSPRTIYLGALKLPPARRLRCGRTFTQLEQYFDPNAAVAAGQSARNGSPAQSTREHVTRAVRRQLVSDVPLGCFLSGGIDSSVVAAAMKASVGAGQKVLTFSIGFEDRRYDETHHARAVAEHLGTEHRQFTVRPDAASDLPRLVEVFGEPFADSSALPLHYLSREARPFVTVALSGEGGDELFGGYDRYRAAAAAERIERLPTFARRLIGSTAWQKLPGGSHPKSLAARVRRFQASLGLAPGPRYASYVRLFNDPDAARLLNPQVTHHVHGHLLASRSWLLEAYQRVERGRDVVAAATAVDRITYLPEDLLTKADRASMLHGLEMRSPFMDHELVGFAAALDGVQLIGGGAKRLLREAFARDLPRFVFTRRKMGFAVPVGEWFRSSLRPMLRDHLFSRDSFASSHFDAAALETLVDEHESHRADHSQRLYALLMLELWWNRFGRAGSVAMGN